MSDTSPLWENEDWLIDGIGLLSKPMPYHQNGGYRIESDRLHERDWISELAEEKPWFNPKPFVEAYYMAWEILKGQQFVRDAVAALPNKRLYFKRNPSELRGSLDMTSPEAVDLLRKHLSEPGNNEEFEFVSVYHDHALEYQQRAP